jgi:hypothetical protein
MSGMSGLGNIPSWGKSLPRRNLPVARTIAEAESKSAMTRWDLPITGIALRRGVSSEAATLGTFCPGC